MIKTDLGLFNLEDTVTNPILITVTNDIKKLLGLNNDIYLQLNEKDALFKTKNKLGKISSQFKTYNEVIIVEHSEISEENNELSLIPLNPDSLPIYEDKEIFTKATPVYHKRKMSIEFSYMSKSKDKVAMLINKLRLTTSSDSMYKTHNLEYSMVIPNIFAKLLANIVELKNRRLNPQITQEEYINSTFDNRIDILNSVDTFDYRKDLVIRECQESVIGYIVDDLHSIKEEEAGNGMWGVTFTYDFSYDKPVTIRLEYPFLIYNYRLHKDFWKFIKEPGIKKSGIRTKSMESITSVLKNKETDHRFVFDKSKYYMTIPAIDTHLLPKPNAYLIRLMGILLEIPDNTDKLLFNLDDLGDFKLKDSVKNFLLESERTFINDLYNSMFYIELHKNDSKSGVRLRLEPNGDFYVDTDLDLTAIYRISINIVSDVTILTKDARDRLRIYLMKEKNMLDNFGNLKDLFLDAYVTLLSIPEDIVIDGLRKKSYQDVIFNIPQPNYYKYYTCETLINITGFIDSK